MKINLLTIFPDFFSSPLQTSILKRAELAEKVEFNILNIREFAYDKHHTTDDRPYGGGPGMVMKVEPIYEALKSLQAGPYFRPKNKSELTILTSAKGKLFTQQDAESWAERYQEITIICGHYEGIDERVADNLVDVEVRIGDFVLTGGETAALVLTDALTRLQPSVLGNDLSTKGESHHQPGILGYPVYTRPPEFSGWPVPEVLLAGHHQDIENWREQNRQHLKKK